MFPIKLNCSDRVIFDKYKHKSLYSWHNLTRSLWYKLYEPKIKNNPKNLA